MNEPTKPKMRFVAASYDYACEYAGCTLGKKNRQPEVGCRNRLRPGSQLPQDHEKSSSLSTENRVVVMFLQQRSTKTVGALHEAGIQ